MADKPAAEKTEQPTPKKLEKAREKGQLPQSQELTSVVTLLVLVAILALLSPGLFQWFATQIKQGMSCDPAVFSDSKAFVSFINKKIVGSLLVICPILAALFAGSALAGLAISGLNFAPQALNLKFSQLNPVTGFEKLINGRSMVKLLASVLKLLFVSVIVWFYIQDRLETLAALRWAFSAQMLAIIARIILGLMIRIGIALLIVGVADAFYQKWKYVNDLKMTRQELKKERKDTDGSPEVKGRIRRLQIEMARRRMLQEVPKASVVLVNPSHVAVALRYEGKTMEAPLLVAKGKDQLAEKIREIARAYGVPIVRRPELARTIYSTVEPGAAIPQNLYVAVAEVLAMIHRLRQRK